MEFLDIKSLVASTVAISLICTLVLGFLWRQSKKRFPGIGYFFADLILQTVALILIILRGTIPDWLSMVASNTLVIVGTVLGYIGLLKFMERKAVQLHNYLIVAIFVMLYIWFALYQPDLHVRNLLLSATLLIIFLQCIWLIFQPANAPMREVTRGVGLVFAGYAVVSLVRIAEFFMPTARFNDFFSSGSFSAIIMVIYELMFILLTYALALMVNKRLFLDLQAEEEKYSKAFQTSPYAITLTRLHDGKIIEINHGFTAITGYTPEEAVGRTTNEINLWKNEDDRADIIALLQKNGTVRNIEKDFMIKNGTVITGLISSDIFAINNERVILSSINDVSDQKKMMTSIQKLLTEKEILLKEVHHRIKNDMNTAMGLLAMQALQHEGTPVETILSDARTRLYTMSKLYDRIYRSERFSDMAIDNFLEPLAREIISVFPNASDVSLEVRCDSLTLDLATMPPVSMIINECITNSMKYAFTGKHDGRIAISIVERDGSVFLSISDNGPGIPESVLREKQKGYGLQLIKLLAEQIDGKLVTDTSNGTKFTIEFTM